MSKKALRYLSGFGNEHANEALPGTLPEGQNAPQNRRAASTPSRFQAHRLRRRAAIIAARGSIVSDRRQCT